MKQKPSYLPKKYKYSARSGNLKAEAVGVVKGEKHFPVFEGDVVFKPLTKSKPLSTPLFAYAEVFWSWVIDAYFMPAPQYQLAFCEGYEAEVEKYYDYGTVSPMIYGEGEHLLNLLEFFRKYPDDKVHIDNYVNYCQMFYDYAEILESDYFQTHPAMAEELDTRDELLAQITVSMGGRVAEELVLQILVSILKGDQNYHYENIAFVCREDDKILRLAPMIDHEFSTYFMFPDSMPRQMYWFEQLARSIQGDEVQRGEFDYLTKETERHLMEKSATCLHKNLVYIRKHYPKVCAAFLEDLSRLENDLKEEKELFELEKGPGYPDTANSDAYLIGKARYKDHDEERAREYEAKYSGKEKQINFEVVNSVSVYEIKKIIQQMREILEK